MWRACVHVIALQCDKACTCKYSLCIYHVYTSLGQTCLDLASTLGYCGEYTLAQLHLLPWV